MAKYLLLIYGDQQAWAGADPAERQRLQEGHRRFNAAAGAAVLAGHELAPVTSATSLRAPRHGDRPDVTDAPFVETKEVVGGFYLLEADDLDEAMRLTALLPETQATYKSGVEIRPVVEAV